VQNGRGYQSLCSNDVVRSTASSSAIKEEPCWVQIVKLKSMGGYRFKLYIVYYNTVRWTHGGGGARGGAVGWGTALQPERSRVRLPMVSLEFLIDIILLAALWPWCRLSLLTEMSTRNISWWVKVARAQGWEPYYLHVQIVWKSGSLTPGILRSCPDLYKDCFTFYWNKYLKNNGQNTCHMFWR
jgi:hypothetical protein